MHAAPIMATAATPLPVPAAKAKMPSTPVTANLAPGKQFGELFRDQAGAIETPVVEALLVVAGKAEEPRPAEGTSANASPEAKQTGGPSARLALDPAPTGAPDLARDTTKPEIANSSKADENQSKALSSAEGNRVHPKSAETESQTTPVHSNASVSGSIHPGTLSEPPASSFVPVVSLAATVASPEPTPALPVRGGVPIPVTSYENDPTISKDVQSLAPVTQTHDAKISSEGQSTLASDSFPTTVAGQQSAPIASGISPSNTQATPQHPSPPHTSTNLPDSPPLPSASGPLSPASQHFASTPAAPPAVPATAPAGAISTTTTASPNLYERIDQGAPVVLQSGPQHVAVGVRDPDLGWVEIRTQSVSGHVDATLLTTSGQTHAALAAQLPGMAEYLQQRDVRVGTLAVHHETAHAGGSQGAGPDYGGAGNGQAADPDPSDRSSSSVTNEPSISHGLFRANADLDEASLRPVSYISVRA